ncbi:hypothetical protein BDW62DRAFT_151792 [Aspergillus aurantiobrunneus]
MGIILFDYCFFTLIAFFGRERKSQCNQHSVSFDGCYRVPVDGTWSLAVLSTPSQLSLPSFHVFLNSAEESFRCFTLEVKDSIFLIVDSCGWSTCINSSFTLVSLYLLLSMTPVSNLSSAARFPLLSFHIVCSCCLCLSPLLSCLLVE